MRKPVSRRQFVGALASGLILPKFQISSKEKSNSEKEIPKRVAFMGMGFGVCPGWFPELGNESTKDYKLPRSLQPLARHKKDFSVIQNMSLQGKIDTHQGSVYYLSDAPAVIDRPSRGKSLISCDQVAAGIIGKYNRYPSLPLSYTQKGRIGHGQVSSMSWDQNGRSMPGIIGAQGLYLQLYGGLGMKTEELQAQLRRKKSVLDLLVRDMKSLNRTLSVQDRARLDQYATSLREVEMRLVRSYKWSKVKTKLPPMEAPSEDLSGVEDVKLTYDLMALAFQADLTRVATYMLPTDALLKSMGHNVNIHEMSHNRGAANKAAYRARDLKHIELLAYFFDKLKDAKESDGSSVFDHSMISFGTGLRYHHQTRDIPLIFAGHGGGGLEQGFNVYNKSTVTPLTNLWFSIIRHLDKSQVSYSSSNNIVSDIFKV